MNDTELNLPYLETALHRSVGGVEIENDVDKARAKLWISNDVGRLQPVAAKAVLRAAIAGDIAAIRLIEERIGVKVIVESDLKNY